MNPAERLAERLREAGLDAERFIDVHDGKKKSTNHTQFGVESIDGNYGIYAGDGLVDIDVDDYKSEDENPGYKAVNDLPDTFTTKTPHTDGVNGGHRLFNVVSGEEYATAAEALIAVTGNTKSASPSWGEVRVRKSYVVGPGSQLDGCDKDWCDECEKPEGGKYEIAEDRPIATITADELADVLAADRKYSGGSQDALPQDFDPPDDIDGDFELYDHPLEELRKADPTLDALLDRPNPGHRDDTSESDFETCIRLLHFGYSTGEVHGVLRRHRNRDKLLEDRGNETYLEKTIRNAVGELSGNAESPEIESSYGDPDELAFWKLRQAAVAHGVLPPDAFIEREHDDGDSYIGFPGGETYNRTLDALEEAGVEHGRERADKPTPATDGSGATAAQPGADGPGAIEVPPKPSAPEWGDVISKLKSDANGTTTEAYGLAADIICEEYDIVYLRESEATYFYDESEGYWVRKGGSYIGELLERHIPNHTNESRKRNIREKVRDRNIISSDEFHPPKGKVNVENGVLDLDTRDLEPHTPDYYFTAQVRAEWPEDGHPDPRAEARWVRALADATDDPKERKKIQEYIGYALETWHNDREKALFFVGPRRTGKSTIQEAIESLFGTQPTVTNLTPQQIADTRFDAAALREAALNTVNDINSRKIEDTGTLKRVFSGERMKMENKFEDRHFAAPNAKHLFTANWLPRLVGLDEALYRRILIVEFEKKVSKGAEDRHYKKRLKESDVRQAILVAAIDGRDRLHEQDGFTNDRPLRDTRRLWDSWRDGHKRFLYTHFKITGDPGHEVERKAYWQAYREFAARNGYELKSNVAITKSLQYVPEVYASGESESYGGLKWKDAPSSGDGSSPSQLSQFERVKSIKSLIEEIGAENDDAAPVEDIIERASEAGIDESQVRHEIDKLCRRGELTEPQTDHYRTTD